MSLNQMWVRNRTTKTNGVSYLIQKGASAVFTEEGQRQIREGIQIYKKEWKIEDQVLHAYQLTMPGMKKELENLSGKTFLCKGTGGFWKLIKETAWEHGTREALEVLH